MARSLGHRGSPFEERPQQVAMAAAVAEALSSCRHLIAEAGTGVGKSFAYLVPLLEWAAATGQTAAVATSTIALQEQLVRKDLPLLQEALPFDVSYALVKGRGNYVCLRRLRMAAANATMLFPDIGTQQQLTSIGNWADRTRDGSLQDLPFRPEPGVWDQVRAERGNCRGRSCPHYGRCHYQRSRRKAHAVRLLVLNHHVLMADLALRRSGASFLPEVDAVVVDEAHDLEDTAAEHLGARLSSIGTFQLLGRLWRPKQRTGLLAAHGGESLRSAVERVRRIARHFFDELHAWTTQAASRSAPVTLPERFPIDDTLSARLRDLAHDVSGTARGAGDEDGALELRSRATQLEAAADALEGLREPREGEVRWAEFGYRDSVALSRAPIDVGPLLAQVLWDRVGTVVLTSATLSTGSPPSFAFLRERLGLAKCPELSTGSSFDYARQVRVRIRSDLPDPAGASSAYDAALPEAVLEAVRASSGGAFVLFTGYGAMRRTVASIRGVLEADGHQVLVQGEGVGRPVLLERFRDGDSVLFGVSSFWQGVDVPGDALRHVVIARLPFEVPTHPLQRARTERLKAEGRDPFTALSLPVAALRLKQGFGRLIRRGTDTGIVTILDPRIVTKRYGAYLLGSLPKCPVERM